MKLNKRNLSIIFLLLGIIFVFIAFSTDNAAFSIVAIVFVGLSFLIGGRWAPRRRK